MRSPKKISLPLRKGLKLSLLLSLSALLLYGCMDDADWYDLNNLDLKYDTLLVDYIAEQAGVFIVNEGNFMYENASLSYYFIDSMKVLNEVFFRTNGVPLGDVAQSMMIRDSIGYITINNSSKVYLLNVRNFEYLGKITGLVSPRYMHFLTPDKAYVSDLYSQHISIVDPLALNTTGYIDVSAGGSSSGRHSSEQFVEVAGRIFTNSWSFDNTILVLDPQTDAWVDSVKVPAQPNSMVVDRYSKIWVLCDGGFKGSSFGQENPTLLRIDPVDLEIEYSFEFPLEDSPSELQVNGTRDTLLFLNREVYQHAVTSFSEPLAIIPSRSGSAFGGYYGLGIDPYSGEIYVADAHDQAQRGTVYRHTPKGAAIDSFSVGINPGNFCFVSK